MPHQTGVEAQHCAPEAYRCFSEALPELHTTPGLVRAAIAVSMHAFDDVLPEHVEGEIQNLALRVLAQCRSGQPAARLAHLHDVLFEDAKFVGNIDNYHFALNSYLPVVLRSRVGLPIVLSLLYKAVGEQVGLQIEGLNTPGHFLTRVHTDEGWQIIDPFYSGQALSPAEAFRRIEQVVGRKLTYDERYFEPASHTIWISRLITNLQALFAAEGRQLDYAAMTELQQVLAGA
ncbi:transglutaminase-like domain-containing protein [Anatilimnocola floriformis]|uniref:transglutaminase-like domain-containing protein n=1 Tax=Anatilimnocola floriformis TaxID=2948575 RepID=UPI0020C356E5|nr:transglutaminase-like domain-containing protein [Anatilimnocola floriformis]